MPFMDSVLSCSISIHAPTIGATKDNPVVRREVDDFNPHSHDRSDFQPIQKIPVTLYFNPRSHDRSDERVRNWVNEFGISIHAPTIGATRNIHVLHCLIQYFNPRSHDRSDTFSHSNHLRINYFNPRSHDRSDTSK